MSSADQAWRPVMAALANPETRRMIGLLIVGGDVEGFLAGMAPSRRRHIVATLVRAGIADESLALRPEVFDEILRRDPPRKATGIDRFLRGGRIAQYPSRPAERAELLRWVASRALRRGEVVPEREMNERLAAFSDDTAVLRRYLVDAGLVERRRDGTEYALVSDEDDVRLRGEDARP